MKGGTIHVPPFLFAGFLPHRSKTQTVRFLPSEEKFIILAFVCFLVLFSICYSGAMLYMFFLLIKK